MTDIVFNTIQYSGIENAIISTPIFNRLHRILQSSMVYLTYSSNKVKRFEHSIGTMHLAGQMLYYSIANADNTILNFFLEEAQNAIEKIYTELDFVNNKFVDSTICDSYSPEQKPLKIFKAPIPDSAFYRENIPGNLKADKHFCYLVIFQAIRIAGLLHDIGHLPYSHVLETAIRTLYLQVSSVDDNNCTGAQKEFLSIMSHYYRQARGTDIVYAIHEEIGKNLFKQIEVGLANECSKDQEKNVFLVLVLSFANEILNSQVIANNLFSDLHRIISGTVDADRLDYCSRDLINSGLRKDAFAYNRLLYTYRLMHERLDFDEETSARKHFCFCPASKTLREVEDLIQRRWDIFSQINYHHRVHKHEIIFSEVLAKVAFDELAKLQEMPKIENGKPLLLSCSSIWRLIQKLHQGNAYIDFLVIQMDDSWVDTLLKSCFFQKYESKFRDLRLYSCDPEWNRFSELISASKKYFSCFKRTSDFREFDKLFCESMSSHDCKLLELEKRGKLEKYAFDRLSSHISTYKENKAQIAFAFNDLVNTLLTKEEINNILVSVEKDLNAFLSCDVNQHYNICNCLIRTCQFSTGYDASAPVVLWSETGTVALEQLSVQRTTFSTMRGMLPFFHLYYLPKYDVNINHVLETSPQQLIAALASIISRHLIQSIEDQKTP